MFSRKMLPNFPRKFRGFVLWVRKKSRKIPSKFPTKFSKFPCEKSKQIYRRASAGAQGELFKYVHWKHPTGALPKGTRREETFKKGSSKARVRFSEFSSLSQRSQCLKTLRSLGKSRTKNQPKEEVFGTDIPRTSGGHSRGYPDPKLRSGRSKSWKNKRLGADIHDP